MNTINKTSRLLGFAFLFQAVMPFVSGMILKLALTVPDNISETMIKIANNAWLMRVNILGDVLSAAGIIFLGAMLFVTLRKQNEKVTLACMGLYILEAALVSASRIDAFSLLRISQEYVAAGYPAYLLTMGNITFETMNFGYTLMMLPFCLGAIPFYYLLYKSRMVPGFLPLWGLITTVFPCLVGTLLAIFGYHLSTIFYLPYIPFEFVIGIWILIKGLQEHPETGAVLQVSPISPAIS
jgi:hypothetical protein